MEPNENAAGGDAAPAGAAAGQIDPARAQALLDEIRERQNLPLGILGGALGAAAGAVLWALITVGTNYQIGWMAIGVGFLAGWGVRLLGKGRDRSFAISGAILALLGCFAGNLLTVYIVVAKHGGVPFLDVLKEVPLEKAVNIAFENFSPIDVLFYLFALMEGYKISLRRITPEEIRSLRV